MGNQRVKEKEDEEARRRTTLPVRMERREAATDAGISDVRSIIGALKDYTSSMPSIVVTRQVDQRAETYGNTFDRIRLSAVPILGERYAVALEPLKDELERAKKSIQGHNHSQAIRHLDRFAAMLPNLGSLIEIHVLIDGSPPLSGLKMGGKEFSPGETSAFLKDSLDSLYRGFGTAAEERSRIGFSAVRALVNNHGIYRSSGESGQEEAAKLLSFIGRLAKDTREGKSYSSEQAKADQLKLTGFLANADSIAIRVLSGWRANIDLILRDPYLQERMRKQLEDLRGGIEAMRKSYEEKKRSDRIYQEEQAEIARAVAFREISGKYYSVTGDSPLMSDGQITAELYPMALELRGKTPVPAEGGSEWFGAIAMAAIADGHINAARVAIAMGLLEKAHNGASADFKQILAALLGDRSAIGTSLASGWIAAIKTASALADIPDLEKSFRSRSNGANKSSSAIMLSALAEARERLTYGDAAAGLRLMRMVTLYSAYFESMKGRQFAGRTQMESAIEEEARGGQPGSLFEIGMARYQLSKECDAARNALSSWGRGLAAQKRTVENALSGAERLGDSGRMDEANELLAHTRLFSDAIAKVAERDRIGRFGLPARFDISGMERSLNAMANAKPDADWAALSMAFSKNYEAAMNQYAQSELERLGALATRLTADTGAIGTALSEAKRRYDSKDLARTLTLLGYINDYFGAPNERDKEGWRYKILSTPQFREANLILTDAIRIEAGSGPEVPPDAAAKRFAEGLTMQVRISFNMEESRRISQWFDGKAPYSPKHPDTRGMAIVSLDDGKQHLMDWRTIQAFEKLNPDDPAIKGGRALKDLLSDISKAALRGDTSAYDAARNAFFRRCDLIAKSAIKQAASKNLDGFAAQLDSMDKGLAGLGILYGLPLLNNDTWRAISGGMNPGLRAELKRRYPNLMIVGEPVQHMSSEVFTRLSELNVRVIDLQVKISHLQSEVARLKASGSPPDEVDKLKGRLDSLMTEYEGERRIAVAYRMMVRQHELNSDYRIRLASLEKNRDTDSTRAIDASSARIDQAVAMLLAGNLDGAQKAYAEGIRMRQDLLVSYRAFQLAEDNPPRVGFTDMYPTYRKFHEGESTNSPFIAPFIKDAREELASYSQFHTGALATILQGKDKGENLEDLAQPTNMIARANMVDAALFSGVDRENSAWLITHAITPPRAIRAGEWVAMAQTELKDATSKARDRDKLDNLAYVSVAVGVNIIPGYGQYISATMFAHMMVNEAITEYKVTGRLAPETQLNLALMGGAMFLGTASGVLRNLSSPRVVAGEIIAPRIGQWGARTSMTFRAIEGGIGAAFAGQMTLEGMRALSEGDLIGGFSSLGMAVFPYASSAFHGRGKQPQLHESLRPDLPPTSPDLARYRRMADLDSTSPEPISPSPGRVPAFATAERTGVPVIDLPGIITDARAANDNMRAFGRESLVDFIKSLRTDVNARKALASYPEAVQRLLIELSLHPEIVKGIEEGRFSPIGERIIESSIKILSDRLTPTGVPRAVARELQVLARPGQVEGLLKTLLDPGSTEAARTGARLRLERIRAVSPEIGKTIDRALYDSGEGYARLRDAVLTGRYDPATQRTLSNIYAELRAVLSDIIPKEQRVAASAERPQVQDTSKPGLATPRRVGEHVEPGTVRPRAISEPTGGSGTGGVEVRPGETSATGGTGTGVGAATTAPTTGTPRLRDQTSKSTWDVAINLFGRAKDSFDAFRAARKARRENPLPKDMESSQQNLANDVATNVEYLRRLPLDLDLKNVDVDAQKKIMEEAHRDLVLEEAKGSNADPRDLAKAQQAYNEASVLFEYAKDRREASQRLNETENRKNALETKLRNLKTDSPEYAQAVLEMNQAVVDYENASADYNFLQDPRNAALRLMERAYQAWNDPNIKPQERAKYLPVLALLYSSRHVRVAVAEKAKRNGDWLAMKTKLDASFSLLSRESGFEVGKVDQTGEPIPIDRDGHLMVQSEIPIDPGTKKPKDARADSNNYLHIDLEGNIYKVDSAGNTMRQRTAGHPISGKPQIIGTDRTLVPTHVIESQFLNDLWLRPVDDALGSVLSSDSSAMTNSMIAASGRQAAMRPGQASILKTIADELGVALTPSRKAAVLLTLDEQVSANKGLSRIPALGRMTQNIAEELAASRRALSTGLADLPGDSALVKTFKREMRSGRTSEEALKTAMSENAQKMMDPVLASADSSRYHNTIERTQADAIKAASEKLKGGDIEGAVKSLKETSDAIRESDPALAGQIDTIITTIESLQRSSLDSHRANIAGYDTRNRPIGQRVSGGMISDMGERRPLLPDMRQDLREGGGRLSSAARGAWRHAEPMYYAQQVRGKSGGPGQTSDRSIEGMGGEGGWRAALSRRNLAHLVIIGAIELAVLNRGLIGYLGYYKLGPGEEKEEDQKKMEDVLSNLGVRISEDNARFLRTTQGMALLAALGRFMPNDEKVRAVVSEPGNMREWLKNVGPTVNIFRLNQLLDAGREMSGKLSSLNDALKKNDDVTILSIIKDWGFTSAELKKKFNDKKGPLELLDLLDLRMKQFQEKDYVRPFQMAVAELFCADKRIGGMDWKARTDAARFLGQNPELMIYLSEQYYHGYLNTPSLQNAYDLLSKPGVYKKMYDEAYAQASRIASPAADPGRFNAEFKKALDKKLDGFLRTNRVLLEFSTDIDIDRLNSLLRTAREDPDRSKRGAAFSTLTTELNSLGMKDSDSVKRLLQLEGAGATQTIGATSLTIKDILAERKKGEGGGAAGPVSGIRHQSILAALDEYAVKNPDFKTPYGTFLASLANDPDKLYALNRMELPQGMSIYGDPMKFIELIIKDPSKAIESAIKEGRLAPSAAGEMIPELRKEENLEILRWTVNHTTFKPTGEVASGMLQFLSDNRPAIIDPLLLIARIRGHPTAGSFTGTQLEKNLGMVAMVSDFKAKGIWKMDEPSPEEREAMGQGKKIEAPKGPWYSQAWQLTGQAGAIGLSGVWWLTGGPYARVPGLYGGPYQANMNDTEASRRADSLLRSRYVRPGAISAPTTVEAVDPVDKLIGDSARSENIGNKIKAAVGEIFEDPEKKQYRDVLESNFPKPIPAGKNLQQAVTDRVNRQLKQLLSGAIQDEESAARANARALLQEIGINVSGSGDNARIMINDAVFLREIYNHIRDWSVGPGKQPPAKRR